MNHRRCMYLIVLLIWPLINAMGQGGDKRVNFEEPDAELLSQMLLEAIDAKRIEAGVHGLSQGNILNEAADLQAAYIKKTGVVGPDQSSRKYATPMARVHGLGGNYALVEEFDHGVTVDSRARLKGSKKGKGVRTYRDVVASTIKAWEKSRSLREVLISDAYYRVGVGSTFDSDLNAVFVSVVMGSEPYQPVQGVKYSKNSYKVRPYDKEVCKGLNRNFSYLPALMSNNLYVRDGRVYFYFHDLNLIKAFIARGSDALAVDIVRKDQLSCGTGNSLHASEVYDGYMLKPLKKGKLLKSNRYKDQGEFLADMGAFPVGLDTNDVELSLMIIQGKCMCQRINYNDVRGKNLRLLELNFVIDTLSISQDPDSVHKHLDFVVPFEKGKYDYQVEDIKPFLDSIQLNRFDIKKIDVQAYSSIEGDAEINKVLQEKRAQSIMTAIQEYQLQKVETSVASHENWEGFKKAIANSPYAADFEGKKDEEIRKMVNSDSLGYNLEPILAGQRKAEISIDVESIFIDSLKPSTLLVKFEKAVGGDKHIEAKALQTMMFKAVEAGELPKSQLTSTKIPRLHNNVPLANNQLAFRMRYRENLDLDSLLEETKMDLLNQLGVDPNNAHLRYNKELIELYNWSQHLNYLMIDKEAHLDQPKELLRAIKKLYNTKVDNWKVNRLLLNYYLIAADYYYEAHQDVRMRDRSLKAVKKLTRKSDLGLDQTYTMANYFIYQMRLDWAVEVMLPMVKDQRADSDFLFTFLRIAIYDKKQVKDKDYYRYLSQAAELDPDRFCKLYGPESMSVQFLGDLKMKKIYCESCYGN